MKKLIAALAICVGTAAFANDAADKVQNQQDAQQTKTRDATQVFTQQPGDSIKESQRNADKGMDATQVGPKISKKAKDIVGIHNDKDKDATTFKTAQAFSMTGTLKDKTSGGVKIERKGLPEADLDIRDQTALWLDGKKVNKDALPEGAQVRAKFQLEGDSIIAVELRATSPKGTSIKSNKMSKPDTVNENGTGGAGIRNDARNLGSDVKSGAKDMGKDVKNGANDMKNDVKDSADDTRDDLNK